MDNISSLTESLEIQSISSLDEAEWGLLCDFINESDNEFTPPLFERPEFVCQLKNGLNNRGLLVIDAETIPVAATLYQTDYNGDSEKAYLTFFRIVPELRRLGIGLWFRRKLLGHLKSTGFRSVVTRTWSTNYPMMRLNEKTNFQRTRVIADDRGPGIDTIYYQLDF